MKAVILAAAKSERLLPFTATRAKPMIRIAGTTILENTCAALKAAGIVDVLIVVNHCREGIEKVMEHGHRLGLSIDYIQQESIDGIGPALKRCEAQIGQDPFLLVYGDVLTTGSPFEQVLTQYTESGHNVAALSLPGSSRDFGNVYLNPEMAITRLVEKPENPHLSNYVFAGMFLLQPEVFSLLGEHGNDMEACYQAMIRGGNLFGALWEGGWIDIRRPWQILAANQMLMDQWKHATIHSSVTLEGSVHIEGPVHIEEDVSISAGTILKGPCYIGRGSFVGNNALIRPYTSLGPESVIGYGTELKNCVLLGKSMLGRLSYLGDSVIGERVHMGTGVTTVNYQHQQPNLAMETSEGAVSTGLDKLGAFIGDDAIIGARHVLAPGTSVANGTIIPDLITIPSPG